MFLLVIAIQVQCPTLLFQGFEFQLIGIKTAKQAQRITKNRSMSKAAKIPRKCGNVVCFQGKLMQSLVIDIHEFVRKVDNMLCT